MQKKKEYDNKASYINNVDDCTIKLGMLSWLEDKKKISLKPSSYERLKMTIESNIIPRLGRYYVADLSSDVIQSELINDMLKSGFSWSTIKKCYDALNGFYKQCIADRKVIYNPMCGVIMPTPHKFDIKKTRALNSDEIHMFEKTCKKEFSNQTPIYRHGYGYIFILYTAIRSGEALALQYST